MQASEWTSLLACAGMLVLAFLVLLRGSRSPIALPLGLLCIDLFVWNFATLAFGVSGKPAWHWLDVTFSPFTPPLALHVVLAFVGRVRRLRWVLVCGYGLFGLLSLSSAAAFVLPAARRWIESSQWSMAFLAGWMPMLVLELTLLVRHLRQASSMDEQMRARLMIAAVLVGGVLGSTEMWNDVLVVPALGHLGTLASMAIMAIIVLRFRLFGHELSNSVGLYSLALSVLGIFGYLSLFRGLGTNTALLVLGTVSITAGLVAAARDVIFSMVVRRERMRQLASLGRFSAQMAHDVKNPLTALKGALQFLMEEHDRQHSLEQQREFLELMGEQVERIEGVMDKYQRLSRVEPELAEVKINEIVGSVLALSAFRQEGIEVRAELNQDLPSCRADSDLLYGALENLVRNAFEAMGSDGELVISTAATRLDGATAGVSITVEDTGEGMDARVAERVFDDFYTTKATGSGLGLAFVRRVADTHGGEVLLSSDQGKGTTVELRLPVDGPTKEGKEK